MKRQSLNEQNQGAYINTVIAVYLRWIEQVSRQRVFWLQ